MNPYITRYFKFWILLLLFLGGISLISISGQSKSELEKRKKQTLTDIEFTQNLLNQAKAEQQVTLSNVTMLQKKIKLRKEVINQVQDELDLIEIKILETNSLINNLEGDLKKIKTEYAKVLYFTYKNRNSYDRLMFILAAENFNQAYRRIRYLTEYSDYRKKQVNLIVAIQNVMASSIIDLEQKKKDKFVLLNQKNTETHILAKEVAQNDVMVSKLKQKEKELLAQLKAKQEIANKLELEIKKIIEAEVKKKGRTEGFIKQSPADAIISGDFRKNRGRLPWPTERGLITSYFGEHAHPVIKGVMVRNNGIDITSIPNSPVRALFDGEVSKIFSILGANNTVIIRHGTFLSVYQNLVNVTVKVGDKVKTKQTIGVAYTEKGSSSSMIHLEIWEELSKLDPQEWLGKK